ncbi:hypothetical protein BP5796_09528 [Coleophoma crateriformis]|uniref:Zn(2)-C6 fungal-type domain-containing protein n=1 Tax=Coleophoma crateriformis TaxID=565419 RepID=A0A3D8QYB6_9HELO|nr:hypothetical protein BP5796_09528 [Coleophoma crateriformis]
MAICEMANPNAMCCSPYLRPITHLVKTNARKQGLTVCAVLEFAAGAKWLYDRSRHMSIFKELALARSPRARAGAQLEGFLPRRHSAAACLFLSMNTTPVLSGRSPKTCDQCRTRKVRCDGRRNTCSNCDRLGFTCSFQAASLSHSEDARVVGQSQSQPLRCRVRQACVSCQALKARCSGDTPSCQRCQEKKIQCVYKTPKRSASQAALGDSRRPSVNRAATFEVSDGNGQVNFDQLSQQSPRSVQNEAPFPPPRDVMLKALSNYFKHIHPLPAFAFLHKASLFQKYNAGAADQALLLAIFGITSQLIDSPPETREHGSRCIDAAANLVLADLDQPSIAKVQTLVLIIRHRNTLKRYTSAFMLVSILSRMAFALRLNYENPTLRFLDQESRRRLMWAVYMLDTTWAGGLKEFTLCPVDVIHLQLPGSEEDFELDVARVTAPLSAEPDANKELSILAYYIRIMSIRYRILRYTKYAASANVSLSEIPDAIKGLEQELHNFELCLPVSNKFTEKNLRLRTYSPQLPRFVLLHIWYHQCLCDLFRFLVPGFRESLPKATLQQMDPDFIIYCQTKCYEHARSIADIITAFLNLEAEMPVMDTNIAVCVYQCARVVYNAYYIDAERFSLTTDIVTEVAEVCLSLLKKLTRNCAMTESIQRDIEDLMANGFNPPSSESPQAAPDSAQNTNHNPLIPTATGTDQMISKHGLIRSPSFVENTSNLTIHSSSSRPSPHHNLHNASDISEPPDATAATIPTPMNMSSNGDAYPMEPQGAGFRGHQVTPILSNWELDNTFQGPWDTFPQRIDPVNQNHSAWGNYVPIQTDYWTHDFGAGN